MAASGDFQGLLVPTDASSGEIYDVEDMLTLEEWCSTERLLTKTEQQYITETTTVFQRVSAIQKRTAFFTSGHSCSFACTWRPYHCNLISPT